MVIWRRGRKKGGEQLLTRGEGGFGLHGNLATVGDGGRSGEGEFIILRLAVAGDGDLLCEAREEKREEGKRGWKGSSSEEGGEEENALLLIAEGVAGGRERARRPAAKREGMPPTPRGFTLQTGGTTKRAAKRIRIKKKCRGFLFFRGQARGKERAQGARAKSPGTLTTPESLTSI